MAPSNVMSEDGVLRYQHLVSDELWARLLARIEQDEGIEASQAPQILDATLCFLKLCAEHPDIPLAPSELVDVGWHTFILYTREYMDFCERHAGRYIHHEPNDGKAETALALKPSDTVALMRAEGITFNPVLWDSPEGPCTGCHP